MPVKPIYHRTPMAMIQNAPLAPGQIHTGEEIVKLLYKQLQVYRSNPVSLEPLFRLGCLLSDKPMEEKAAAVLKEAIARQREDGSFSEDAVASLAIARGAMAMYEYSNDRDMLSAMLHYCAYVSAHWTDVMECTEIRRRSADLMELFCQVYRYSGKKPILTLCEKLRREAVNWTGILHTYNVKRPTSVTASWLEMRTGMEREHGAESGQYTRMNLVAHAETLADGMRSTTVTSLYSGSSMESSAARIGWDKISRFHRAVCGGTTADEFLEGNDPLCGIDAAALGAWSEAFVACLVQAGNLWAAEEMDILMANGLRACLADGKLNLYQRVNYLDGEPYARDFFHTHLNDEQRRRALFRLGRACSRIYASAVMTSSHGADVFFPLEGDYDLQMNGVVFRLLIRHIGDGHIRLTVQTRDGGSGRIRIRVPSWMTDLRVRLNNRKVLDQTKAGFLTFEQTWKHGDAIDIVWTPRLVLESTFHQGVAVRRDNILYSLPGKAVDGPVAMVGMPFEREGRVYANFAPIRMAEDEEEQKREDIEDYFAEIPVLPHTLSPATERELFPYTSLSHRLTVVPRSAES